MIAEDITPLIITFDEAPNIARSLGKLLWAKRIVIVDSGSTDETLEIIAAYPQAQIFYHKFSSFADQCNFGLSQIKTDWALSLDADYELSDDLVREIFELKDDEAIRGYCAGFTYRIHGRPLRGSLYPPRTVLYRVLNSHYENEGHGHRVSISGNRKLLRGVIYHDDRKPLLRWFRSQQRYAELEAIHLLNSDPKMLTRSDIIRRAAWPAPVLVTIYVLLIKGCLLDGWAGWFYTLQRLLAETMIALAVIERRLGNLDDQKR